MALTHVPSTFDTDSEEEVRVAVTQFFRELGFELDELSFEDHFTVQLGRSRFKRENTYRNAEVERASGYSDMLLIHDGMPLAIVEVKHTGHDLTEDDAWQAVSYARLLRGRVAAYAIVTNGRDTRVYDPLAESDDLVEIETATDAVWDRYGRSVATISEDLKHAAARRLIGINADTLHAFCQDQVKASMEDLKGFPSELKEYVPAVYLPRTDLAAEYRTWLDKSMPAFAVVAESGAGKTNFMCATAEQAVANNFALFYSGQRLLGGLAESISRDFVWEFRRELNIAHIVERFSNLAERHDKKLIIFIDALDEFIGDEDELKAELLDFVRRIDPVVIKLCLSCKAYNWEHYVTDYGQTYNRLARLTYPQTPKVRNPVGRMDIAASNVGYWLGRFSDEELGAAFHQYRDIFALQGELQGETREECQLPLMLRVTAEVYADRDVEIPSTMTSPRLFQEFLERKLSRIQNRMSAELLLNRLANSLVLSGRRYITVQELAQASGLERFSEDALSGLLRVGLVTETRDTFQVSQLSFRLEKLRNYIFCVHVMSWGTKRPLEVAAEIRELLEEPNQLLFEVVEFFFSVIDRGESEKLTELALQDLPLFAKLMENRDGLSFDIPHLNEFEPEDQPQTLLVRLKEFCRAYTQISRRYFSGVRQRIPPYTDQDVGVWMTWSPLMYQLRACTESYPNPVVIEPENINRLVSGSLRNTQPAVFRAIGKPAGQIQMGVPNLARKLPQQVAWKRLLDEISILLKKGLLDESSAAAVLQERSNEVLAAYLPVMRNMMATGTRYHHRLGFDSAEEVHTAPLEELVRRVDDLLHKLTRQAEIGFRQRQFWRPFEHFYVLRYWLAILRDSSEYLPAPRFTRREIVSTVFHPETAVGMFDELVPEIREAYRSIVQHNFDGLSSHFELFASIDRPILIEVTGGYSNPLSVRYAILKTVELDVQHLVYWGTRSSPLADQELVIRETLRGGTWKSVGGKFGRAALSLTLNGRHIEEPEAVVYRTRFPSIPFITNQVYQLITAELEKMLPGLRTPTSGPEFDSNLLTRVLTHRYAGEP